MADETKKEPVSLQELMVSTLAMTYDTVLMLTGDLGFSIAAK